MAIDLSAESCARRVIWQFLMQRRLNAGYKRCYLVSYPRSGSTLVRGYFAILQGRPQLSIYAGDVVQAKSASFISSLDHIDLVKSHQMPASDDPVIYLVRDGRNATLSFLHMSFLFGGHRFSDLSEVYDAIRWLDRAEGCWADHVAQALQQAQKRPVLFVRYEDLVAKPETAIEEMIRFMGAEVFFPILAECVRRQKQSDHYAENPYNGFLHRPPQNSIYDMLLQHRRGAYWRNIFDSRSKQYFHACGATRALMHFGYEDSENWWKA
jgi:Sulfotransferase domain